MKLTHANGEHEITIRCVTRCRSRGKQGHRRGLVLATVDGFTLKLAANQHPDCTCAVPDCWHLDAVRELIDPDLLRSLDECDQ